MGDYSSYLKTMQELENCCGTKWITSTDIVLILPELLVGQIYNYKGGYG